MRDHLNRMLTTDISNDSIFTRRVSTICDLNGRITSRHLHADYGSQILLMHNESESVFLRNNSQWEYHGMKNVKFHQEMEQLQD